MALQKYVPGGDAPLVIKKSLSFSSKANVKAQSGDSQTRTTEADVDVDFREIYFLIMHFLSAGPCQRTCGQLWNELLEHQLLPRRYHAWYSRNGAHSGDADDDGLSFPLSYIKLVERYPHVEKDHLVKLLKQLILNAASPAHGVVDRNAINAAAVPTLLGTSCFSLLSSEQNKANDEVNHPPSYMRWPHMLADQVHGLSLREIGGGFSRHHRAPSIRAACYAIAKPSTMVQKMQNIKRVRGHRYAVYCAIFDRSGRFVITGSDDRLVKIWSMETAYCLASCRGHEGDITDLAVNFNNSVIASASNDCIIRVWRLNDGCPISVLRGHTGAVTAIAFSPRPGAFFQLLSSSDDGTCRIWDARCPNPKSTRVYVPKPSDPAPGKNNGPSSSSAQQSHQIFCCAFNSSGTVFVTGSSDTLARVWNACKGNAEESGLPNHEMDVLAGHENDVNYVQFSGCAVTSRFSVSDTSKEENIPKFKNTWYNQDNIVTCSRDGSAIIWIPRSRRSHGKIGRWTRAYHLKVPPPPMPPQPPRGGPRQRVLPTPRGVNMIVWSLDNRFVLAAIMDCRICVWNAADGSLVHSLTGHTESTYVLDVHPFNPRIAMSAGYDGKTIVWDIWEGTPVRTYEIGRFKLVDGKFSPDGTSIILSDDVGQLYILSTGQGESQMDAKYDQFFLGDYRPLIQDTHGNVLDQETQLLPYRRNMQDLLCDSALLPYPEPYQSMYQQRRHGILGIEWRPSSVKFAVGADISLDQDYQMLPIADLDVLIDPLPEFLDVRDWEPEIEIQSDDTDSEYHITEEISSGGEQGSLISVSSGDLESSGDDSEAEDSHKDGLRRSKRKKQKAEIEVTTSSGRRVKRKNLDEYGDSSLVISRSRKSKLGRKVSRKRSSLSKSLRPQRAAARNALHLFSRITGTSADLEEEYTTEGDSSGTETILDDSSIVSEDSDLSLQNEGGENLKGKQISVDQSEDLDKRDLRSKLNLDAGAKRRLVLKLPNRDASKFLTPKYGVPESESQRVCAGPSSTAPTPADEGKSFTHDHKYPVSDGHGSEMDKSHTGQPAKIQHCLDLLEGCKESNIGWGGVKTRTSKRSRVGESMSSVAHAGSIPFLDGHDKTEKPGGKADEMIEINKDEVSASILNNSEARNIDSNSCLIDSKDIEKSSSKQVIDGRTGLSIQLTNGKDDSFKLLEKPVTMPTKLRIKSRIFISDHESSGKIEGQSSFEGSGHNSCCMSESSDIRKNSSCGPLVNEETRLPNSENGIHDQVGRSSNSVLLDLHQLPPQNRIFSAVYRRSKSLRGRSNQEHDNGNGASTSAGEDHNLHDENEALTEGVRRPRSIRLRSSAADDLSTDDGNLLQIEGVRKARSIRLRSTARDSNFSGSKSKIKEAHGASSNTPPFAENSSVNRDDNSYEEQGMGAKVPVMGLRPTRNRRSSYYDREASPPDKRKPIQSTRSSWLLLSTHEEGFRYIPQQGDDVVYLRQGHQEYIAYSHLKDLGPWSTLKGHIRAVEFCKVEELEYSTIGGSGESCCKILLKFVDLESSVVGKSFRLVLPEVTSFPDFLVERSRYDAAISRKWTSRDKCQVWWKNEGEEDGSWWEGRILAVKPKSPDFPDSPWESYVVQYKSDPRETHQHSPWELYDADTHWEQPHIDVDIRDKLLTAFAKLERSVIKNRDYYGVQKLREVSQKASFINRFPVPLSLEVIQSRLENNYYRSLDAMKHDVKVLLSNAESYFGRNADGLAKVRRLSDWFTRILC
ncbi:uncharacterized protein [Coffea arabica]|uniref:Bromo domain-containing protein n=1 Tax=Coffea arabica TaxID=13443 RepID=A0ABM4UG37_COFAR